MLQALVPEGVEISCWSQNTSFNTKSPQQSSIISSIAEIVVGYLEF